MSTLTARASDRPPASRTARRPRTAALRRPAALPGWRGDRDRWTVRPIRPDEVAAAADLQAAAFYSSYPLGPLDALLYYTFRGEVLSGLQSKMKYTSDDGFLCLVAEPAGGGGRAADDAPPIAGVVEVSLQGEKEELTALTARGLADDSYAYVACMAVDERARRQGVAKALLSAAERAAARWRQNWVLLHVHTDNEPAVGLYRACGYTRLEGGGEGAQGSGVWGALGAALKGRPKALLGKVAVPSSGGVGGVASVMSIRADLLALMEGGAREEGGDGKT